MPKEITKTEAAELFGFTTVTMNKFLAEGLPHEKQTKEQREFIIINSKTFRMWLEKRAREETRQYRLKSDVPANPKQTEHDVRYRKAKAAKQELELAEMQKKVVGIQEVTKQLSNQVTILRSQLLTIPQNLTPGLQLFVSKEEIPQIVEFIDNHIRTALENLSDEFGSG